MCNLTSFIWRAATKLAKLEWYQNLAAPVGTRLLVVFPGERKEEIVDNFGDILRWDETERETFGGLVSGSTPTLSEGKFFPGTYVAVREAGPETIGELVLEKFDSEVLSRYSNEVSELVPLEDALVLASLLEREAYDFEDMRQISGVVWNRLFIGMNLQIDATLQYAKGSLPWGPWWPNVRPQDKYIKSPFNTYQNAGLPPAPISNPSTNAILAALNPVATDCMYYFHDDDGEFHCTPTYEEHVALLKQYYGQGR